MAYRFTLTVMLDFKILKVAGRGFKKITYLSARITSYSRLIGTQQSSPKCQVANGIPRATFILNNFELNSTVTCDK